jgi:hypothetical protein
VTGSQSGLDNLWKGMSGGKGFAGLMHNLGDSIVGGFGNIISGGLTSVINMGVQLAVEGVKKIGSLIAGPVQVRNRRRSTARAISSSRSSAGSTGWPMT